MKTIRRMARRRRRSGSEAFSLAELMVVVVIIALLTTLVVQNVVPKLFQAKGAKARADISTMRSALDNWVLDNNGKYPDTLEVLVTPNEYGDVYLQDQTTLPLDPWGNPYHYEPPTSGGPPRIICYGEDGQPGGDGKNEDIDNLMIKQGK